VGIGHRRQARTWAVPLPVLYIVLLEDYVLRSTVELQGQQTVERGASCMGFEIGADR
jgi:hypothetical protein